MAKPAPEKTQTELLATLLAHHVMETIIANKIENPDYLPQMTDSQPVVHSENQVVQVSDYFSHIGENFAPVSQENDEQLYWTLKQFNCHVDTYYLEGFLYKVIVYITYHHDGREMKIFLERLMAQPLLEKEGEQQ
jgi:hypothetical protein